MKIIKTVGHPILLITLFMLLIVEGDHFGGFYLLYLLLALPHGALYAIIAVLGFVTVLIGYNLRRKHTHSLKPSLYIAGLCLMITSLVIFFAKGNKYATFELAIPLLSFILFGICTLFFLINTFSLFSGPRDGDETHLKIAT